MASADSLKQLSNLTTQGVQPIPRLVVPSLPDRLVKIDPNGCAKYQSDLQSAADQWVDAMNTINGNIVGLIPP